MIVNALIVLGAAIFVVTLFHSMKLPPVVAFISAGILIGPAGFGLINSLPQVDRIGEIAAMLLMFTLGLEFSLKDLMAFRRPLFIVGIGQVVTTVGIFIVIFWQGFGYDLALATFLALLVAPSSTAVVLKLLQDQRDLDSPYGKAAFSVLLMQDIAVIPMIVAVPFLAIRNTSAGSFVDSLFPLLILITLALVVFFLLSKYALPFLLHRVSRTKNREIFFFTILFLCVGSAALMNRIGLSVSLGAFVAGMLLAGSNYGKQAVAEVLLLRDSFLCLFFVALGMMVDLNFLATHLITVLPVLLLIVLGKASILFGLVWLTGSATSVARATAALLFQMGEFSLVLGQVGRSHGLMDDHLYQYFITVVILSLILTPLIYTRMAWIMRSPLWDHPQGQIREAFYKLRTVFLRLLSEPMDFSALPEMKRLNDHVIVVGYGVGGKSLCRILDHLKISYQVIELNAETVRIHSGQVPIVYGDAANPQILAAAGIGQARLLVALTSGVNMLEPILRTAHRLNPQLRMIARTHYLMDLPRLEGIGKIDFVVSEVETSLQVIQQTLSVYQMQSSAVTELTKELKKALMENIENA